jgi:hypothetical protein
MIEAHFQRKGASILAFSLKVEPPTHRALMGVLLVGTALFYMSITNGARDQDLDGATQQFLELIAEELPDPWVHQTYQTFSIHHHQALGSGTEQHTVDGGNLFLTEPGMCHGLKCTTKWMTASKVAHLL